MRTTRTARKVVGLVSAAAVSLVMVGGTIAAVSTDDAGRGIQQTVVQYGRGI